MASSTLLGLPLETLHNICDFLYDTHKPSLASCSLVNKRCCIAATTLLFRHLTFDYSDPQKLHDDFLDLSHALERRHAYSSVRRLTLSDAISRFTDRDEASERHWQPLLLVIERMPGLQNFEYEFSQRLPAKLMKALQLNCPDCQLHKDHFDYRDLFHDGKFLDKHCLARSEHLTSVNVYHGQLESTYHHGLLPLLKLIATFAPKLRNINLSCSPPVYFSDLQDVEIHLKRDELDKPVETLSRVALESFTTDQLLDEVVLMDMGIAIDFSKLLHLTLIEPIDATALQYWTTDVTLPQLKSLKMHIMPAAIEGPGNFETKTILFLESLSALECLDVDGAITKPIVNTILLTHGIRLRKLIMELDSFSIWSTYQPPRLTMKHYRMLHEMCPLLQELGITVYRHESRGSEILCYQLLAKCKSVRKLSIDLKCDWGWDSEGISDADMSAFETTTPSTYYDPTVDDRSEDEGTLHINARRTLANCALDEALARSIWQLITSRKQGCSIQSLTLQSVYPLETDLSSPVNGLETYFTDLCRKYELEPPIRDDAMPEDVIVRESSKNRREEHAQKSRKDEHDHFIKTGRSLERKANSAIFRCIWPERTPGGYDWRDDWHSIPLQIDSQTED